MGPKQQMHREDFTVRKALCPGDIVRLKNLRPHVMTSYGPVRVTNTLQMFLIVAIESGVDVSRRMLVLDRSKLLWIRLYGNEFERVI